MTLTIDAGHSHLGIIFWNNQNSFQEITWDQIYPIANKSQIIALSQVKAYPELEEFKAKYQSKIVQPKNYLRDNQFNRINILYSQQIGEDRLICTSHLAQFAKGLELVIDAGTYVTVDIYDTKNFHGGWILPGLKIYSKLFSFSDNLASTNFDWQVRLHDNPPKHTQDALHMGYQSFICFVLKILNSHPFKKITLTGGDAAFWHRELKSQTQLTPQVDNNLLHSSLYQWSQEIMHRA